MKQLVTAILLCCTLAANAQKAITGTVISVHDGDTFTILACDSIKLNVRLWGVDAPELKQVWGENSANYLADLVGLKQVALQVMGKEKYGRLLCVVRILDTHMYGVSVNEQMLKSGNAWQYNPNPNYKSSKLDISYTLLMQNARKDHLGMWVIDTLQAPWVWRKEMKFGAKHR